MSRKTDLLNRVKELAPDANTILSGNNANKRLAIATLISGMLIHEGLHAVADSIEKMGHREVAADTMARAVESRG